MTIALALFTAENPVVDAVHAPGLDPDGMARTKKWNDARAVGLKGSGGADAQHTSVSALWNEDWLFFSFSSSDQSVFSPGKQDGLDHFLVGDTAEVFVARRGAEDYAEIHATPAGYKTVYFFSGYRQPAPLPRAAARARVEASGLARGWKAWIAVPRALLGAGNSQDVYEVFFARYDYDARESQPVLSSFPAQEKGKPDFHRRTDYAALRLMP